MKFYIATKFENKQAVADAITELIEAGHEVPYDWSSAQVKDEEQARNDVEGVRTADALIGIFDADYAYKGAIAEIGMAIILGKPIFIIGNWLDNMIFMYLTNVKKVNSVREVIAHVAGIKGN